MNLRKFAKEEYMIDCEGIFDKIIISSIVLDYEEKMIQKYIISVASMYDIPYQLTNKLFRIISNIS